MAALCPFRPFRRVALNRNKIFLIPITAVLKLFEVKTRWLNLIGVSRPWPWPRFGKLDAMRAFVSILALFASGLLAAAEDSPAKPVLSFSLTATNQSFTHRLESGLTLRVERNELGWDVGVFQRHSTDNLLYPQGNWHGAFPCQLSAWSQRRKTFADQQVMPIRGYKSSVRIRLVDVVVAGKPGSERFTGGWLEISEN
jgi:hypothetical protein